MPRAIFEATFTLLDSQMIPGKATAWICEFGGDRGWRLKRWKLTKTQPHLVLPEMRNLAVKPQEAWGERLGAGRGGSEPGGGAWEGSGPVTKSFAGGRWKSPGSAPGNLWRQGRKEISGRLPLALLPASLLFLVVDLQGAAEGRMYQTWRRKNPYHLPPWHQLRTPAHCGSAVLWINSSKGRRQIGPDCLL